MPQINPFADSVPFPESQIDSSYERMEEVSLEQLLAEGRGRPATMSGNVPLPDLTLPETNSNELLATHYSLSPLLPRRNRSGCEWCSLPLGKNTIQTSQ